MPSLSLKSLPVSWGKKLQMNWNWYMYEMNGNMWWNLFYINIFVFRQAAHFSYRQDDMLSNFLPTILPPSHHKIWFHFSTKFGFLFPQFRFSTFQRQYDFFLQKLQLEQDFFLQCITYKCFKIYSLSHKDSYSTITEIWK